MDRAKEHFIFQVTVSVLLFQFFFRFKVIFYMKVLWSYVCSVYEIAPTHKEHFIFFSYIYRQQAKFQMQIMYQKLMKMFDISIHFLYKAICKSKKWDPICSDARRGLKNEQTSIAWQQGLIEMFRYSILLGYH